MKHNFNSKVQSIKNTMRFFIVMFFVSTLSANAAVNYNEYKGTVVDKNTGNPLAFAGISLFDSLPY